MRWCEKIKKKEFKNLEEELKSLNNDEIIVLSYSSIEKKEENEEVYLNKKKSID